MTPINELLNNDSWDAEYTIPGRPVPLRRPRFAKNGKAYDSQKDAKFANGLILKQQHGNKPLFDQPIHVECTFYFSIPKSLSKKKREMLTEYYIGSGDTDNFLKKVLDEGNKILWSDDRMIVSTYARKMYGEEERTVIRILTLD